MQFNVKKKFGGFHLSMAPKIRLAIGSIVAILLITALISIIELGKMSTFVSDSISADIDNVTLSTELAVRIDEYNTAILTAVGDADNRISSEIDKMEYLSCTDSIMGVFIGSAGFKTDSLQKAYIDFVVTANQLDTVIVNDFVDSRVWYFTVLQPKYNKFRYCHELFNAQIHGSLMHNSRSFDQGVYRSLMPCIVSVAVGIIMCLLLQFFILSYYVRPMRKMLKGLEAYLHFSHPYTNVFDGDDELQELNADITELTEENLNLRKKLQRGERQGDS